MREVPDLIACEGCDALYRKVQLHRGEIAHCPRCGTELDRDSGRQRERILPLTVASLIMFAIANSYVTEVQTVSNSFSPEFGKIGGDIYNVITGSGNNQFHGQVQYIGRPLDLVARHNLAPGDVKRIHVSTGKTQLLMLRNARPQTGLEAKFSMQFAMAAALVARHVGLREVTDEFVLRPEQLSEGTFCGMFSSARLPTAEIFPFWIRMTPSVMGSSVGLG